MELIVKRLHPDAVLPKYATPGAACFDLVAIDKGLLIGRHAGEEIKHWNQGGEATLTFRTGLSFAVPEGWAMLIFSRSGHGFKHAVRLANCVGVIDSDYRGEVMVRLTADSDGGLYVRPGDRMAQAMLVPVHQVEMVEVNELPETQRGAGGFGSTGA